jgi:hypothetical protein
VQLRIVIRLGPDDGTTEVENRLSQQILLDQEEKLEDSPGAAIAILEGMNRLELVVADGIRTRGSRSSRPWRKRSQFAINVRRRSSPSGGVYTAAPVA